MNVPWDDKTVEWPKAFYDTVKASLVDPIAFFTSVADGKGIARPMIYAIIINMIVFVCLVTYQAGFVTLQAGTEIADLIRNAFSQMTIVTGPLVVFFALFSAVIGVPIMTIVGFLIQAGLYHLGLIILGGAKRDFAATFRTVCYSTGPQVLQIIPILGGMAGAVWVIVLNIIGLKVVHETSYARSAFAVFLPLILCCGIVLLIMMTVAGSVVAALMMKQS